MIGNEERECSDREMDAVMKANDKQCTRSLPILPLGRKIGALVEVAEWPAGILGPACSEPRNTLMAPRLAQNREIMG